VGKLDGKVAVVTGAGGGLGRAISTLFASEGASVVCQDLIEDAASATVAAINDAGGAKAMAWTCDVTDSASIEAMFDAATTELGTVNVLVSNAGVASTPGDGTEEMFAGDPRPNVAVMSDAGWQRMLDIHLNGAFYTSRAMINRLLPGNAPGSIVCMSSIAGLAGWGQVHYSTAKGGLLGFVRALAREVGPRGIRVNAVCPGAIDTPMTAMIPAAAIDGLKMLTPLGRIGEPADIAAAALYLSSDDASFVTGQALSPNGGIVMA
jgi:3-oxoacyl-[acyl-carrier protein] reductase